MAAKETDVSIWLQNKLGSVDELWSSSSICAQLTREKLQSIRECFMSLQPHVKVKLLLSFLHLPKRSIEDWSTELEGLLKDAESDYDQWVSVISSMLRPFPTISEISSEHSLLQDIKSHLKLALKKNQDSKLIPLECAFLNKGAASAAMTSTTTQGRHFSLKRKPKSAALRIELLQKSTEVANSSKKPGVGHGIPVKFRSSAKKLENDKPMSSIGGHSAGFLKSTSLARSFGGNTSQRALGAQREGGIKLLDFSEMPAVGREAKRRRRMAEVEAQKKSVAPPPEDSLELMPDYAAGLLPQLNAAVSIVAVTTTPTGPTYIPAPLLSTTEQAPDTLGADPPAIYVNPAEGITVGGVTMAMTRPNVNIATLQGATPGGARIQMVVPRYATQVVRQGAPQTQPQIHVFQPPVQQSVTVQARQPQPRQAQPMARAPVAAVSQQPVAGQQSLLIPRQQMPQSISIGQQQPQPNVGLQQVRPSIGIQQVRPSISIQQPRPTISIQQQRPIISPQSTSIGQPQPRPSIGLQPQRTAIGIRQPPPLIGQPSSIGQIQLPASIGQPSTIGQLQLTPTIGQASAVGQPSTIGQPQLPPTIGQPSNIGQLPPSIGQPTAADNQQTPAFIQSRRNLSLTREQMFEAQELFRVSNRVTRPEKALILGFMAGSRDNPCPHQGDLVNIRLSENEDSIEQPDGTFRPMMVETYFQMNYSTGEWRKIRKYRELQNDN